MDMSLMPSPLPQRRTLHVTRPPIKPSPMTLVNRHPALYNLNPTESCLHNAHVLIPGFMTQIVASHGPRGSS